MYDWAVDTIGFGLNGDNAAMVDDQLKNIKGLANTTEFTSYHLTRPDRYYPSHAGVLLFRPVEKVAARGLVIAQAYGPRSSS